MFQIQYCLFCIRIFQCPSRFQKHLHPMYENGSRYEHGCWDIHCVLVLHLCLNWESLVRCRSGWVYSPLSSESHRKGWSHSNNGNISNRIMVGAHDLREICDSDMPERCDGYHEPFRILHLVSKKNRHSMAQI